MKKILTILFLLIPALLYAQQQYLVPVGPLMRTTEATSQHNMICAGGACYYVTDKATADRYVSEGMADSYEAVPRVKLITPVAVYASASSQWSVENSAFGWSAAKSEFIDILPAISRNSGPVIATVDSGMALHKDLGGFNNSYNLLWILGTSDTSRPLYGYSEYGSISGVTDSYAQDNLGHGTHVAGIAGAADGSGMKSTSYGHAQVIPFKVAVDDVYNSDNLDFLSVIDAINHIVSLKKNQNIPIVAVNMSYGSYSYTALEYNAIKSLYDAGIIAVTAAGNENTDIGAKPMYPASFNLPNIVTVAALDESLNIAYYSNYGGVTNIAAPGSKISSLGASFTGVTEPERLVLNGSANLPYMTPLNTGWSVGTDNTITFQGGKSANNTTFITGSIDLTSLPSGFYRHLAFTYDAAIYCDNNCAFVDVNYDNTGWQTAKLLYNSALMENAFIAIPKGVSSMTFRLRVDNLTSTRPSSLVIHNNITIGAADYTDSYMTASGTSMAAPYVTGALAAAKAVYPGITPQQLITLLYSSATVSSKISTTQVTGSKQINLYSFLDNVTRCKNDTQWCSQITDYPSRQSGTTVIPPTHSSSSSSSGLSCAISGGDGGIGEFMLLTGAFVIYMIFRRRKDTL